MSQVRRIERPWEETSERESLDLAGQIRQCELDVMTKLPNDLATGSARRSEGFRIGYDGYPCERSNAFRNRFEDSDSFRAERKAIGGVFDVAAAKDFAVFCLQSRADLKI